MPPRDRSAEAVALQAECRTKRDAERRRLERIVKRVCERVRLERLDDEDYSGATAASDVRNGILTAMRGTR